MFWDFKADRRKPLIIGHRGAPLQSTENTLHSYRHAITLGASAVEVDIQITVDGHVVCCHDPDLMRVAGSPLRFAEATLDRCQAAYHELATLDEVASMISPAGVLIDTKSDEDVFIDKINAICVRENAEHIIMIGTANPEQTKRVRDRTHLPICGLFKEPATVAVYRDLGISWVRLHACQYSKNVVDAFHNEGIGTIMLAKVEDKTNSPRILAEAELWLGRSIGCAAYLVDNPDVLSNIR